jgi:hypothetical protein
MADSFDEVVISVWRQILVQNAKIVQLDGKRYLVKRSSRHHFRQVDFTFNGQGLRGIEQNPGFGSRRAKLAREGKKDMQFLRNGRYVAVVVDGQVFHVRFQRPSRGARLILHGLPDGVGSWTAAESFHRNFYKGARNHVHSQVFMNGQRRQAELEVLDFERW